MDDTMMQLAQQEGDLVLTDAQIDWLLAHVGDLDGKIRDQTVYSLFGRGFFEGAASTEQQKRIIAVTTQENNLFKDIEQPQNDRVFLRSFTALLAALFLEKETTSKIMTPEQLDYWFDAANKYLRTERDWRGYVPENGWAHAIAHGSDLLATVVAHPDYAEVDAALQTVRSVFARMQSPFLDDEEERLANILVSMFNAEKCSLPQLADFLNNLNTILWTGYDDDDLATYYRISAFEKFVRTIYFRLPAAAEITRPIIDDYFHKMGYDN